MTSCPCCSNPLLRHIRHNQVYWFCRNCWQEMPPLENYKLCLAPIAVKHLMQPRKIGV